MSERCPSIRETAAYLRREGRVAMAHTVEALAQQCQQAIVSRDDYRAAYERLLAQASPQYRPPDHVARGLQSD